MKKLYTLLAIGLIAIAGCKKTDFDLDAKGEALNGFSLKAPLNNTMLVLNSATPMATVSIEWNPAAPGVETNPTYKWIAALKTGNLDAPYLEIASDNSGKASTLTLTQKALDDALKAKGVAEGVKTDLIWSVQADNGTVKVRAGQTFNISVTRFGDGVSNFKLYGPLPSTDVLTINPNSTTDLFNFKWQKSFAGKAGNAVTYKVKFVKEGESFNTPLMEFVSKDNGSDSTFTISYKDFDAALTTAGLSDQATPAKLQWTVEAKSGSFTKFSDYTNSFTVAREVKMFLVGGDTPVGWSPDNAIQMIPDKANPGTFYAYVYLTTDNLQVNNGFKFINQRQWPGGSLNSSDWGMKPGSPGDAQGQNADNIQGYGPSGVYRVTFDQKNLKYYVEAGKGRMGAVGGATAIDWQPSLVFPTQELFYVSPNKFLGFADFNGSGKYKFIDNNDWGNGARDYGTGATAGSLLEQGESDIDGPTTAGTYRLIWDGTDVKNLKYSITKGAVYLIGSATAGDWANTNPEAQDLTDAQRPPMIYMGTGKWEITTFLKVGELKFIVEKGSWAYDYGGKDGKITGDNIAIGADGTYTVKLDEVKRTYNITPN